MWSLQFGDDLRGDDFLSPFTHFSSEQFSAVQCQMKPDMIPQTNATSLEQKSSTVSREKDSACIHVQMVGNGSAGSPRTPINLRLANTHTSWKLEAHMLECTSKCLGIMKLPVHLRA